MFKKLFGTDGIRGIWGDKISPELAFDIGKATAIVFERENEKNKIVIGKDTRLSCDALEYALIAGITSMGVDVIKLDIVPTAVIPFSIEYHKANAGIMITASHNPAEHNGFKFFNGNGFKISEEQESHIEHIIANSCDYSCQKYDKLGRVISDRKSVNLYIKFVIDELKICKKTKICFDCANGCVSEIIKDIFKGYNATVFNAEPDGLNTNVNCGANHIDELKKIMENSDFEIGFSFDGDADRVRVSLAGGKIVSGENVIYLLAKYNDFKKIVTTKMSNMALCNALEKEGIESIVADIGEKAVLNGLLENNAMLGGENNGHYMLMNKTTTSDGILVCAQLLSVFETDKDLNVPFEPYFQIERAVYVKNKEDVMRSSELKKSIELCEELLMETGRILVRAGGTEDAIRVLVEGEDENTVKEIADILCSKIS